MHLLKILELLHILRNNPEPVEGVIAEALDPAFVAAEVGLVEPSIADGGSTAPARDRRREALARAWGPAAGSW